MMQQLLHSVCSVAVDCLQALARALRGPAGLSGAMPLLAAHPPQVALQYLQQALALEEAGGPVQNSSSTHLNICAAFSALKRPKEVRGHRGRLGHCPLCVLPSWGCRPAGFTSAVPPLLPWHPRALRRR